MVVTALAVKVTPACYTEDEDRRDVDSLFLPVLSDHRGASLPVESPEEENGLSWVAQCASQGVFEEYSQGIA